MSLSKSKPMTAPHHRAPLRKPLTLSVAATLVGAGLTLALPASADHLDTVVVTASGDHPLPLPPASVETLGSAQINDTINATSAEDTLKYLPSLTVRKRNEGDTQSPLATRTSGVGASARSLIYVDGILLSALIGNNNTYASPRWNMVSVDAIDHIDVLYGPFSAAYAGNSTGAVVNFTTRLPKTFTATASVTGSLQQYSQYGHNDNLASGTQSFTLGDRIGGFTWSAGLDHLDTHTQPIAYNTALTATGTTGGTVNTRGNQTDFDKYGRPIQVFGASTLLHYNSETARLKLGYEVLPNVQALYQAAYWQNDVTSDIESFLTNTTTGAPVLAGNVTVNANGTPRTYSVTSGFASGIYTIHQAHVSQALSLKGHDTAGFNWEVIASRYDIGSDDQRTASNASTPNGAGKLATLYGTGWKTFDAKGDTRLQLLGFDQNVSAGLHSDHYILANPTYNLASTFQSSVPTSLSADGEGQSSTRALWAEDRVRVAHDVTVTAGVRKEWFDAYNGLNFSGTTTVRQPAIADQHWSPKLSVAWDAPQGVNATYSLARAWRFPTVGELYQLVTTGATLTAPNPNLTPEGVVSQELALEHALGGGRVRLSLFQEDVANALISQTSLLNNTAVNFAQNIQAVRARGIELAFTSVHPGLDSVELDGSVTLVNSRIVADGSYQPTIVTANGAALSSSNPNLNTSTTAVGKRTPNVPRLRASLQATWRPDLHWVASLGARFSGQQYSTIDNVDPNGHTYQGFEQYFVMDARVRYKFDQHLSAAFGVDNLNNRNYWLFHPFPQRTYTANLRYEL